MNRLFINPISEKNILKLVKRLPQSLLLSGDDGVGLSNIGKYIAEIRNVKPILILPEKDEKIDIENGIINVEIMRRLYEDTRTKPRGDRIIIIDYADRMTNQAQNAFLKLLEEPGDGTYFILVCHSPSKMLPTILSRVEKIQVRNITRSQSEELLDLLKVTDKTKRNQILFIAEGLQATITNLVNNAEYFEKSSQIVCDARELIRGNQYKKLLIIQKYKDNRLGALSLILNMTKILKLSLTSNPQPEAINRLDVVLDAYDQIEANGNIRLVLASTVI